MLCPAAALAASIVLACGLPASAVAAGWIWPVRGDVVEPYGYGGDPYASGQHRGVDVRAPLGAPVRAATGGTVRFAGAVGTSGLVVTVRTADGRFDTSYLHLASTDVHAGQRVPTGRRIATVGDSGRPSSSVPHLHFGVRVAGGDRAYRDPLDFLPPLGRPARGPAPQPLPVPVARRPIRFGARTPPRAIPRGGPDVGWALACLALIALAATLGRSSIGDSCRTTSQPRSTTSTASPTSATSTRR